MLKNEKEANLLKELLPILAKYELSTVENCMNHINDHKQIFLNLITNFVEKESSIVENCMEPVNEHKQELSNLITDFMNLEKIKNYKQEYKNEIEKILSTTTREKKLIIRKIYTSLSNKKITIEQIYHFSEQYFEPNILAENLELNKSNKNKFLLEVMNFLKDLDTEKLEEILYSIPSRNETRKTENTLENWTKIIMKHK